MVRDGRGKKKKSQWEASTGPASTMGLGLPGKTDSAAYVKTRRTRPRRIPTRTNKYKETPHTASS